MKGLLLKDLLVLRRYGRTLLLLTAFYAFFALMEDTGAVMSGMIAAILAMTVLTSVSYDEQARWDRYACSLPVGRRQIVGAKYLLGLLFDLTGCILSLLIGLSAMAMGRQVGGELAASLIGAFSGVLLLLSLMLPLVYRFGVEKSRIIFFVFLAITMAVVSAGALLLREGHMEALAAGSVWVKTAAFVLPAAAIFIYALSYRVSCRIYGKKEL